MSHPDSTHKVVQVPDEAVEKVARSLLAGWPSREAAWLDGCRHGLVAIQQDQEAPDAR